MAVLKCKMCGGDIVVNEEKTFGVCDYCGSTMTLPKVSDEQRAAMFNRGNHFRRIGEFDKALAIYENIVRENDADAEAHWCCVLCRFGIEYVEDPSTYEYIPTCHRASYDSILEDVDYLTALEYSDGITRRQYQKDAAKIAEIQKGILATSQNEEPFDAFICYKETDDATNERTRDSIDAQEIYYQLTNEGYRVFFSRITLEDKVGTEYEPYIFAALNSAKVMVVIGSKPEYLNAVWVKNEWSRFIALMRKDRSKLLIPCYKDMDPYDLPEQLSVLQSYDMTKIGFIQDLIRGIKKVAAKEEAGAGAPETVVVNTGGAGASSLLERAFIFLEDGNWDSADEYAEKVLDLEPKNAEAYLVKLMVWAKVSNREELAQCSESFGDNTDYKKIERFGSDELREELAGYIALINERNENDRLTEIYNNAVKAMNNATTEAEYKSAAKVFQTISGFKGADTRAEQCLEKAENARLSYAYNDAVNTMKTANTEVAYKSAAEKFKKLFGFKDADVCAEQCLEKAEIARKDTIYTRACVQMSGEKTNGYEAAINAFRTIPGWKDSDDRINICQRKIEEIKAREENIKEKSAAIAASLKAGNISKNLAPLKERLTASKTRIGYLTNLLKQFDEAQIQIGRLREDLRKAETQEADLQTRRSKLGVFSGKEKKQIDEVLSAIDVKKREISNGLNQQEKRCCGYNRRDAIERDLAEAKDNASKLEEQLEREQTRIDSVYSYDQALKEYLFAPDMTSAVNAILYPNASPTSIFFGRYSQNNSEVPEPVEWQVLGRENGSGRILVISKQALGCWPFHVSKMDITWETCSLRKWLNTTFLNTAFTDEERALIPSTSVGAHKNPGNSIDPGNETTDQVFLLSIMETQRYLSLHEARQCEPTPYAVQEGAQTKEIHISSGNLDACSWWLRTPGNTALTAAYVSPEGGVDVNGIEVNNRHCAVRPAMWIKPGY